ncbi:MAG: DUF5682 family protein [Beijerinckiaceae bacterium]|nr:DUF5682 family protein [Beijerinckiaceae bacterium]
MDTRLHLLGIRHHGPGSAASVLQALDLIDPDIVLIEGVPEADDLIHYAALPGMQPPLALLVHGVEDPSLAIFLPYAEFSPEWQAMLWAIRKRRPVRFIDLPAAVSLAVAAQERDFVLPFVEVDGPGLADTETSGPETSADVARPDDDRSSLPGPIDPLDRLAELTGYPDGESWWNALVETRGASTELFRSIEDAMTALRGAEPDRFADDPARRLREERREAQMRLAIRDALKQSPGPVAVICGAWHVPALRQPVPVTTDKAVLRDLPRIKVNATWIPWTDERLAAQSGYGAGVISPGWYRHLWTTYGGTGLASAEAFAAGWQTKVAQALRDAGHSGATASAIDAARLSISLAALRGHATPGLDEMRDATLAALCHGDEIPYRLIERRLFIGESIGSIDESTPQMPLAADLARWQKRLRLKPQALAEQISLDLRSEAGLQKSTLLHRLLIIAVPWGVLVDAGRQRGTFREVWTLSWAPELSVKLAEALVYGVTIEQAAANRSVALAKERRSVGELAGLVRQCLLADLPEAAELCIGALQAAAVNAGDMAGLMQAVPPLVSVLRYGTARPYPESALRALVSALCVEVNAGLYGATQNLADDAARNIHAAIRAYDEALQLQGDSRFTEAFLLELERIAHGASTVALLAGFALRRLHDRGALAGGMTASLFSRRLSPSVPPKECADFLEGFLDGAAQIVAQDRTLLGLVDEWLMAQDEAAFVEILPMLRRSFSSVEAAGRRLLLQALDTPAAGTAKGAPEGTLSPAFDEALPLLLTILGLDGKGLP